MPSNNSGKESKSCIALFAWASAQQARLDNLRVVKDDEEKHGSPSNGRTCTNSPQKEDSSFGSRCIHATRSLQPGDEVAFVPHSLILTETVAANSEVGQALLAHLTAHPDHMATLTRHGTDPHAFGMIILAVYMVHAFHVQSPAESWWWDYLNSLPKSYLLPLCWPEQVCRSLLSGTSLLKIVEVRRTLLQDAFVIVQEAVGDAFRGEWTYERLLWAYAAISSRAFPKMRDQEASLAAIHMDDNISREIDLTQSELCLYPVLDLLNHRRGVKMEWRTTKEGVSFVTREPFAAGVELVNNYGSKGNENLLGSYGFVLADGNPEDYVKVLMRNREEDPLFEVKRNLVANFGIDTQAFLLFEDDEFLNPSLLNLTRILALNEYDILHFVKDSDIVPLPFSFRNEMESCRVLQQLIGKKLSDAESAAPSSETLKTLMPKFCEQIRLATAYRNGQIRILKQQLQLLSTHVHQVLDPRPLKDRFWDLCAHTREHAAVVNQWRMALQKANVDDNLLDDPAEVECLLIVHHYVHRSVHWFPLFDAMYPVFSDRLHQIENSEMILECFDAEIEPVFSVLFPGIPNGRLLYLWSCALVLDFGVVLESPPVPFSVLYPLTSAQHVTSVFGLCLPPIK